MDAARPDSDWLDDGLPVRKGRKLRWAALVGLLVIVALAAFYLTWSKRADRRLAQMVDQIKRAGEPVSPEELVHPPIPPDEDAAVDLLAAMALLDNEGELLKAVVAIDFDVPLSSIDVAAIAGLVQAERDVLEKVRGARGKTDADWKIPYQSPMLSTLLPHLNVLRSVANVSRAAAVHERINGNDAAALEHVRDILAVARATDNQPTIVGHLVGIGIGAVANHHLAKMAPDLAISTGGGGSGATPEQVRATIAELLEDARSEAGVRAAMRGERVMLLDTMKLLAERKLDLNAVSGGPGMGKGFPPIPRGIILSEAAIIVGHNTDVMRAYEQSPDYATYKKNAPPFPAAVQKGPKLHFIASLLMPAYDRFIIQHYRARTERRLVATGLALRLYAVGHGGAYPKTLDELVPNYLPAVPKDPFAAGDKPLDYSVTDATAPLVYSVGEDGVDDGGSMTPTNPRRTNTGRWDKKDVVLQMKARPMVKSAEEEEKAKSESESEE